MLNLLVRLVRNLLGADVYLLDGSESALQRFELEKNPLGLSHEFSGGSLKGFIDAAEDGVYYEIVDRLNQRIYLFRFESKVILIGPYLKKVLLERDIEEMHAGKRLSVPTMEALKIQYFNCPVLDSYRIETTLNAIMDSLPLKRKCAYSYRRINPSAPGASEEESHDLEGTTMERSIYRKYEVENDLLYKVEHGLVEELSASLATIMNIPQEDELMTLYSANPQIAMASFRTMIRKAAEKSGLSVLTIDKIISKYTQIMHLGNAREYPNYVNALTLEMAEAVRDFLLGINLSHPTVKDIANYLFLHYDEKIGIDALAAHFNLSKSYLEHLFKSETGKSVREYLEDIRLRKAEKLLLDTTLSIATIASRVGYLDNNYFAKVFRKKQGMTPTEYRRKNR